jgi:hypothetical protein
MPVIHDGARGVTLMGLPPSGTFVAKWLMLEAALRSGSSCWPRWWSWGGLLAAGYLFRVLAPAIRGPVDDAPLAVPRAWMERAGAGRRGRAARLALRAPRSRCSTCNGPRLSSLVPGIWIFTLPEEQIALRTVLNLAGAFSRWCWSL